jgi:hypothetical protein
VGVILITHSSSHIINATDDLGISATVAPASSGQQPIPDQIRNLQNTWLSRLVTTSAQAEPIPAIHPASVLSTAVTAATDVEDASAFVTFISVLVEGAFLEVEAISPSRSRVVDTIGAVEVEALCLS